MGKSLEAIMAELPQAEQDEILARAAQLCQEIQAQMALEQVASETELTTDSESLSLDSAATS